MGQVGKKVKKKKSASIGTSPHGFGTIHSSCIDTMAVERLRTEWDRLLDLLDGHYDEPEERTADLGQDFDPDSAFVQWYLDAKPRGTRESWLEDVGFPVFVLEEVWVSTKARKAGFSRQSLLWLLSWLRKHHTFRSMAAEWGATKTTFERVVKKMLIYLVSNLGLVRSEKEYNEQFLPSRSNTGAGCFHPMT